MHWVILVFHNLLVWNYVEEIISLKIHPIIDDLFEEIDNFF